MSKYASFQGWHIQFRGYTTLGQNAVCRKQSHANPGLEKLTNANQSVSTVNANQSVSTVNDRLFPVELIEIDDWKSMSEYMLHSNFGKNPDKGHQWEFWCIHLYIAASLFPKYLSTFLDVL